MANRDKVLVDLLSSIEGNKRLKGLVDAGYISHILRMRRKNCYRIEIP